MHANNNLTICSDLIFYIIFHEHLDVAYYTYMVHSTRDLKNPMF